MKKQPPVNPNKLFEQAMRGSSRRDFLKLLGSFVGGMTLQSRWQIGSTPAGDAAGNSKGIPVPPTLMLHTHDRWKLRNTLAWLADRGYSAITYKSFAAIL